MRFDDGEKGAPRRSPRAVGPGRAAASTDYAPLEVQDVLNVRKPADENVVRAPRLSAWDLRLATARYLTIWRNRELWNYSYNFGQSGARYLQRILGRRRIAKLRRLRDGETSYVVVRGLPTASVLFPYPDGHAAVHNGLSSKKFRHFDMLVAGLLFLSGAEVRRRYQNAAAPIVRTLLSAPTEPHVGDRDGSDMHLRFHQSTVEKGIPDPNLPAAGEETCIVKAYAAVRNRRRIPIYVLPLQAVMNEIRSDEFEWVTTHLMRPVFQKIGPHFDNNDSATTADGQPVLRAGARAGDWIMSFDPDRVHAEDENAKRALRKLRGAVMRARKHAVEVTLDRRDVLIVDNLRALVSRREYYPLTTREALRAAVFKKPRWMRLYYGFPLPRA
ncbi:MAG: hypothetical protein ACFB00_13295 [Parvularculaceae bacterium]